jgi:hypothetical protein
VAETFFLPALQLVSFVPCQVLYDARAVWPIDTVAPPVRFRTIRNLLHSCHAGSIGLAGPTHRNGVTAAIRTKRPEKQRTVERKGDDGPRVGR